MKRLSFLSVLVAVVLVSAVWATGCEKSYKDKEPAKIEKAEDQAAKAAKEAEEAKKAAEEAAAKAAAGEVAKTAADDAACFGAEDPNAPVLTFEAKGVKYEIKNNFRLFAQGVEDAKPLTIGVLTDLKTDIPKNIINLKWFYSEFAKANVDVVVVTGDVAEEYDALKKIFSYMGEQGYLTLVIMGNRDKKDEFNRALNDVQGKYKNLVNMNHVRFADLGPATVLSLPGYYDANYIHHRPGCEYGQMQVDLVAKLAGETTDPTILISHGPMRGEGATALDSATEAGNVGDPNMAAMILKAQIPFGIFGNIHEAGGKGVGRDFKTVVPQGAFVQSLYLNPGPADSDPWNMNDETISRGMAGVFSLKDKQASYKILRISAEQQMGADGPSKRAIQEAAPAAPAAPKGTMKPNAPAMQQQ
jgi:Icc-related predicted phosphoesterase